MKGQYRDHWSATANGTYWRAAQFLALEKIRKKIRERDARKAGAPATRMEPAAKPAHTLAAFTTSELAAELLRRRASEEGKKAELASNTPAASLSPSSDTSGSDGEPEAAPSGTWPGTSPVRCGVQRPKKYFWIEGAPFGKDHPFLKRGR